ncbi:MAG: extracellular solute-binding protein [Desulfobacterales bacterium]|nr:extracellular solute-binding protein [Desulfobacterales bacterium]
MKRLNKMWLFLIVCGAMITLLPLPAHSNPLDPYIQAAKKEGEVRIGVPLRNKVHGKPAGELYFAAFQKRYPFLKVNFKRIGGSQERERLFNEMVAGIYNFDVAVASETTVPTIMAAKLPLIVEWEKLGVLNMLTHPENMGVHFRTMIYGIAYNRDLVPDEVARTFTWETCTDPKWKGKTAMDDRPRHLIRLFRDESWGREKTLDYVIRWAANKPAVEASRSTGASKLAAGAYHMICGAARDQVRDLEVFGENKSIGIVFPEPVPVLKGAPAYVLNKAKHPNAGILFLVWTGTQEGQKILDDINFSGHPAFDGTEANKILKGKQLSYATSNDTLTADDDLVEILRAFGMPVVRSKAKKKK